MGDRSINMSIATYDRDGNLIEKIEGTPDSTMPSFAEFDLTVTTTDPAGNRTTTIYRTDGRIVESVDEPNYRSGSSAFRAGRRERDR
jgi:YD repeat-containing protein